uniref:Uncharacterized protein n=2 Tax=Glossina palpalis gambiensis TaxID=67801 RepID=A0A1B0C2T8_9MUSC
MYSDNITTLITTVQNKSLSIQALTHIGKMGYGNSWTTKDEIMKYWTFARLESLLQNMRIWEDDPFFNLVQEPIYNLLNYQKMRIVNKTKRFPKDGLYVITSHGTVAQLFDNVVALAMGLCVEEVDKNIIRWQKVECYRHLRALSAKLVTPPLTAADNFIFNQESFDTFYGLE